MIWTLSHHRNLRTRMLHWWQDRREQKARDRKRRQSPGYKVAAMQMIATEKNDRQQKGWVG